MKGIYDFGITSFDGVIERINSGAVQGFDDLTSEHMAASYEATAAIEAGYGIDADQIESHLDVLSEGGAEFDYSQASSLGVQLAKAAH